MINPWFLQIIVWFIFWIFAGVSLVKAETSRCLPIEKKPVKIKAWLSKRYEKNLRQLRKKFTAIGNTRVTLWVYPSENPSKIVAIGRCIPAYIARHTLRNALRYSQRGSTR